jgi:CDP-glycerol glycerophosphotransferase
MKLLRALFSLRRTRLYFHFVVFGLSLRFRRGLWSDFFAPRPGKIVMSNQYSDNYGQNPRYIAEELLRRNAAREIVWIVEARKAPFRSSGGVSMKTAPLGSFRALFHAATARVLVTNSRDTVLYERGLRGKPGQTFIHCGESGFGVLPESPMPDFPREEQRLRWMELAWNDAKKYDFLLSNHANAESALRRAFFGQGRILNLGYARNDVFFAPPGRLAETRRRVFAALGAPEGAKLLLYVPAYRPGDRLNAYCCDLPAVLKALSGRFGGSWVAAAHLEERAHPFFKNLYPDPGLLAPSSPAIRDARACEDLHAAAAAADALVSDVTPLLFDFLLSRRPAFALVPDMEELEEEHGRLPFGQTPLAPAGDSDELCARIRDFDETAYRAGVDAFLERIGAADDGRSAARAADLVEAVLDGKA